MTKLCVFLYKYGYCIFSYLAATTYIRIVYLANKQIKQVSKINSVCYSKKEKKILIICKLNFLISIILHF